MERQEMVLADMHLRPGEPWEYCPREALRRVLKVLKDEFDLVCPAFISLILINGKYFILYFHIRYLSSDFLVPIFR
jgi:hypothetical protein